MSWQAAATVALALGFAIVIVRWAFADVLGTATWDMARAAGFTAYLLLSGSVIGGMAAHMRIRPAWLVPTWLIESHRILSVLSLSFVAAHVIALLLDEWVPFTLVSSLVPFQSSYRPIPVALGTIGLWMLVFVLVTTALSGFMPWKTWKRFHYVAFPCWCVSLAHGLTAGTDAGSLLAIVIYTLTSAAVATLLAVRIATARHSPRGDRRNAHSSRKAADPGL